MEAQASKPDNPILIVACIAIACIAVNLLCAAAIAAIMAWIPASEGGGAAPQTAESPAKAAAQDPAQTPVQAPAPSFVTYVNSQRGLWRKRPKMREFGV